MTEIAGQDPTCITLVPLDVTVENKVNLLFIKLKVTTPMPKVTRQQGVVLPRPQ